MQASDISLLLLSTLAFHSILYLPAAMLTFPQVILKRIAWKADIATRQNLLTVSHNLQVAVGKASWECHYDFVK